MPLFLINNEKLSSAKPMNFSKEKEIQTLIEKNLEVVFNCKFIESEYSTGPEHGGRIDTLALSEDNNPVIIEYKKVPSSELLNQSLYYLSWIKDHKGDFKVAVDKRLKENIEIDWSDIRVICIAPEYKKYDLLAAKVMGVNIELWQYKYYNTNILNLEVIFNKSIALQTIENNEKEKNNIIGKEESEKNNSDDTYTFNEHLNNCDDKFKNILLNLREYILSIDKAIIESPQKKYISYKVSQNFVSIVLNKSKIILYLKLFPEEIDMPGNARDVTRLGHLGTGDLELTISNEEEMEKSKEYIKKAFENIGG